MKDLKRPGGVRPLFFGAGFLHFVAFSAANRLHIFGKTLSCGIIACKDCVIGRTTVLSYPKSDIIPAK
jgi:hypothetical protein